MHAKVCIAAVAGMLELVICRLVAFAGPLPGELSNADQRATVVWVLFAGEGEHVPLEVAEQKLSQRPRCECVRCSCRVDGISSFQLSRPPPTAGFSSTFRFPTRRRRRF